MVANFFNQKIDYLCSKYCIQQIWKMYDIFLLMLHQLLLPIKYQAQVLQLLHGGQGHQGME